MLTIASEIESNMSYFDLLKVKWQNVKPYNESETKEKKNPNPNVRDIERRYGEYLAANKNKKAIIITARVHPGEM